jgi:hypothetical protein
MSDIEIESLHPTTASDNFNVYRQQFPFRLPNTAKQAFADEMTNMSGNHDVCTVMLAPDPSVTICQKESGKPRDEDKYLWLIKTDNVVAAIEKGESGTSTSRGCLAHTNLSGGLPAHAGGELWFEEKDSIWLNGGSSRYRANSKDEMDAVVNSFRRSGYRVGYCGWNTEENVPARDLFNVEWLENTA